MTNIPLRGAPTSMTAAIIYTVVLHLCLAAGLGHSEVSGLTCPPPLRSGWVSSMTGSHVTGLKVMWRRGEASLWPRCPLGDFVDKDIEPRRFVI